jgi:hypothetical protein
MLHRFHLRRRTWYPWLFIGLAIVANAAGYALLQPAKPVDLFILITGAVAGFVHFLYSQDHKETQLFVALFKDFNERYDKLNEKLNAIVSRGKETPLSPENVRTLYDYFNLCAEEHLYYASGYIDHEVWLAWVHGMKYFAKDAEIRKLWEAEVSSGSYYSFNLSVLDAVLLRRATFCCRLWQTLRGLS